jgi:hypothetical protein
MIRRAPAGCLPSVAALLAAALPSQEWDLRSDWSDTFNPNGPWEYRVGFSPPPAQAFHDPTCWALQQPAWARSAAGNDRTPALFRDPGPNVCNVLDLQPGDVAAYSDDPVIGVGGLPARFTWKSLVDGQVAMTGAIWLGRDVGNNVDWAIEVEGTTVTFGTVITGDAFDRASPFFFEMGSAGYGALQRISVLTDDEITLVVQRGATSPAGEIVGVEMTICEAGAGLAAVAPFGIGCATSAFGVPDLQPLNLPILGSRFWMRAANVAPGPVVFVLGDLALPGVQVPGAGPGCSVYTSLGLLDLVLSQPPGFADHSVMLPCNASFSGFVLYYQAASFDTALATPLPIATSNRIDLTLGF